jgi:hypothetical protein
MDQYNASAARLLEQLQWRAYQQTRLVSLIDSTLTAEARGAGSSAGFCRYF